MSGLSRFYVVVDDLWKATKMLVGQAGWTNGYATNGARWLSPLAVDGVTIGMNLCVDSFPRSSTLDFHISLIYETSICRLDFSEHDRHNNHAIRGIRTPPNIPLGWVFGPHLHSWDDNKVLVNSNTGPKELEFATPLPDNVKTFDAAFRHFCGVANIVVASNQVPGLPRRDTLL